MDDRNVERQVWQRVHPMLEAEPRNDLRQMQREAMELAAAYRTLMAQLTGRKQELARRLYLGEKANAQTLGGIGQLSRQSWEALKLWQPGKESAGKMLEQCYHRTRRCMTEYLARSAEGEYGVVFRGLADREGEHCAVIAELLGSLG